jgi:lipid-binding SYLF domain-containing protein
MFKNMSVLLTGLAMVAALVSLPAAAANKEEIDAGVQKALQKLYASEPGASALGNDAKGILVFPEIFKAGLIIGGEGGEGALLVGGKTVDYYSSGGLSYGLQAGAQEYSYALFFMDDAALKSLDSMDGWEVGVGPTIVVVDEGAAKNLTTKTAKSGVYAFIFSQEGLMAGIGVKGNKITKIKK